MVDYDTPKRAFLQYIIYVLYKRKGLITWGFLSVFLSFVLATQISYPYYKATAKIWVHRTSTQSVDFFPDIQRPNFGGTFLPPAINWIEVLNGKDSAKMIVEEFKIDEMYRQRILDPQDFRDKFWHFFKLSLAYPFIVMMDLGILPETKNEKNFVSMATEKVIDEMISIDMAMQFADVMAVSIYAPTPKLAENIANYLARSMIERVVKGEQGVARFAIDFANQQVKDIAIKLGAAEDNIISYQKQLGVLDIPSQKNQQVRNTNTLETQIQALDKGYAESLTKYNTIQDQIEEQKRAFISNILLQKQLTDAQRLEVDIQVGEKSKAILEEQLSEAKERADELIEAEFISKKLAREIKIYENIWSQFQDKIAKLNIETVSRLKAASVEIVDHAFVPEDASPEWPKSVANYVLGIILGITTGLGMALTLEYFNDSLRTQMEVEKELNLPFLASIPEFTFRKKP